MNPATLPSDQRFITGFFTALGVSLVQCSPGSTPHNTDRTPEFFAGCDFGFQMARAITPRLKAELELILEAELRRADA